MSPDATVDADLALPRQHYDLGVVWQFVRLVTYAACPMASAARVLELDAEEAGQPLESPHSTTGRMWLLRLGHFKLHRPKERADDWVWILDHTNQIGQERCLMIVGFRLSQWAGVPRPLTLEDLEPMAILPVTHSDKDVVSQQLEEQASKTGDPRAILSDEGGDLVKAEELFCRLHPETCYLSDIAHRAARSLKRRLEHDPHWTCFVKEVSRTKFQVQQTELGFWTPPSLRNKARYMNVKPLVNWAEGALFITDQKPKEVLQYVTPERLEEKLAWLREYRADIHQWSEYQRIIDSTLEVVRHEGYFEGITPRLKDKLGQTHCTDKGTELCAELIDFAQEQSKAVRPGERLPGSSEILESAMGKFKFLEKDQSRAGFTHLVLGFAATLGETSRETVRQAMIHTPVKNVVAWCRKHLGPTLHSKRTMVSRLFQRHQAQQKSEEALT